LSNSERTSHRTVLQYAQTVIAVCDQQHKAIPNAKVLLTAGKRTLISKVFVVEGGGTMISTPQKKGVFTYLKVY
jgi:hypothetical protein